MTAGKEPYYRGKIDLNCSMNIDYSDQKARSKSPAIIHSLSRARALSLSLARARARAVRQQNTFSSSFLFFCCEAKMLFVEKAHSRPRAHFFSRVLAGNVPGSFRCAT
jgi:hypothetical protein